jgi:hypothetical protein
MMVRVWVGVCTFAGSPLSARARCPCGRGASCDPVVCVKLLCGEFPVVCFASAGFGRVLAGVITGNFCGGCCVRRTACVWLHRIGPRVIIVFVVMEQLRKHFD